MDIKIKKFIFDFFENPKEIICERGREYVSGNLNYSNHTIFFDSDCYIVTKGGLHIYTGKDVDEVILNLSKLLKNRSPANA